MLKDLRHAVRVLLHAGWTAVVILSLALGIGANTAIFSAVSSLLLTQVPIREPNGLVRLRSVGRNDMRTSSSDYGFSARSRRRRSAPPSRTPMYQQFLADNQTMTDRSRARQSAAPASSSTAMPRSPPPSSHPATTFRRLARARLGRTILPDDDEPTAPVAVISSKYWNVRFGADPNVVGKTVNVNGVLLTIVGVVEPGFTGIQQPVGEPPDVSVPLVLDTQLNPGPPAAASSRLGQATFWWLQVIGRLQAWRHTGTGPGQPGRLCSSRPPAPAWMPTSRVCRTRSARAVNRDRKEVPRLRVEAREPRRLRRQHLGCAR